MKIFPTKKEISKRYSPHVGSMAGTLAALLAFPKWPELTIIVFLLLVFLMQALKELFKQETENIKKLLSAHVTDTNKRTDKLADGQANHEK